MNKIFILLLVSTIGLKAQVTSDYSQKLNAHRAASNQEFGDTATSILPDSVVLNFKGLNYYPPNPKFNITANFKKAIGNTFEMMTSSGKMKKFRRYGFLNFELDNQPYQLPIYQNMRLMKQEKYKDYIFIPFTDQTNGLETYGGGRYIEAKKPTGKTYNLDFNYAFNPYCHYTDGYSCPIPPKENYLDLEIKAGEKIFSDEH